MQGSAELWGLGPGPSRRCLDPPRGWMLGRVGCWVSVFNGFDISLSTTHTSALIQFPSDEKLRWRFWRAKRSVLLMAYISSQARLEGMRPSRKDWDEPITLTEPSLLCQSPHILTSTPDNIPLTTLCHIYQRSDYTHGHTHTLSPVKSG